MLRGQTYDGTSNMSGEYCGCQAIIAEIQPLIIYVHCGAHCVNLVSQAVNEACPAVRDALQVVNKLGPLFTQSLTACMTVILGKSDHCCIQFDYMVKSRNDELPESFERG